MFFFKGKKEKLELIGSSCRWQDDLWALKFAEKDNKLTRQLCCKGRRVEEHEHEQAETNWLKRWVLDIVMGWTWAACLFTGIRVNYSRQGIGANLMKKFSKVMRDIVKRCRCKYVTIWNKVPCENSEHETWDEAIRDKTAVKKNN